MYEIVKASMPCPICSTDRKDITKERTNAILPICQEEIM